MSSFEIDTHTTQDGTLFYLDNRGLLLVAVDCIPRNNINRRMVSAFKLFLLTPNKSRPLLNSISTDTADVETLQCFNPSFFSIAGLFLCFGLMAGRYTWTPRQIHMEKACPLSRAPSSGRRRSFHVTPKIHLVLRTRKSRPLQPNPK